jgi:hypothetical protein
LNTSPLLTIYLRRRGDHAYAVAIQAVTRRGSADQFRARLLNMVRLGSGQTVSVRADLQPEYGATRDEAFSRIEAAIEKWRAAAPLAQAARRGASSPGLARRGHASEHAAGGLPGAVKTM